MTKKIQTYSAEEVLEIFIEQHRLCSPLDPEADRWAEITAEMSIREWRWANDLLEWKNLSEFLNQEFRINIPDNKWFEALEPAKAKKLSGVCTLISNYAVKDSYEAKKLFGTPCIKAGLFLTIKRNLERKGVDVSELKPSSNLAEFLNKYFSPVLEEITLTGAKGIEISKTKTKNEITNKGFWKSFKMEQQELVLTDLKTFRDLMEKIIENTNRNFG